MSSLTQLLPGGRLGLGLHGAWPPGNWPLTCWWGAVDHEPGSVMADRCGSCCSASLIPWAGQQGED